MMLRKHLNMTPQKRLSMMHLNPALKKQPVKLLRKTVRAKMLKKGRRAATATRDPSASTLSQAAGQGTPGTPPDRPGSTRSLGRRDLQANSSNRPHLSKVISMMARAITTLIG